MADPRYVDLVLNWLESNWDSSNYPGTDSNGDLTGKVPAFVDKDDTTSTSEYSGRKVAFDLSKNNAVIVSSSPDRTQEPIGSSFDYRFEDGVSIRVVAAHESEVAFPGDDGTPAGVAGSDEFRQLYQEVRRVLHADRVWPNPNQSGSQHAYTLRIPDETNLSSRYQNLYEYDITVLVRGHEEL
ncbi:hypothetical protein [Halorussus sp. AFM4]|uniref:hypothetical protein n=1 Tax=Halorussus sp. AFM4 TaxID=3421651 RepID=UPI003EB72076